MLFQKLIVRTNFDIYVFITLHPDSDLQKMYHCLMLIALYILAILPKVPCVVQSSNVTHLTKGCIWHEFNTSRLSKTTCDPTFSCRSFTNTPNIAIFRICYGENGTVKFFETLADNVFRHNYSMMQIKKKLNDGKNLG
jgi:hypothetical protein